MGAAARYTGRVSADHAAPPARRFRAANVLLTVCAALGACASMASESARVIVTLAPGVEISDPGAFERTVRERTSVRVTYAAAVSERMHALHVHCETSDAGCAHAQEVLRASGLFSSLTEDQRRKRQ